MRTFHEKQSERKLDLRQTFEFHQKGLRDTWSYIKSAHTPNKIGDAALHDPRHATYNKRHAFARSAQRFLDDIAPDNPVEQANATPRELDEQMYASIIAEIPKTVSAKRTLFNRHATQHQHFIAKMDMIEFDDMLRTTIDTHPDLQEPVIVGLMTSAMLSYGYEAGDINMLAGETKKSLRGMKHELGFKDVLKQLPEGYEILKTTNEDDKQGADDKVRCPNGIIVSVDVKASEMTADKAIERQQDFYDDHYRDEPKNKIILYSGFEEKDFDPRNPWHPKPEAIQRVLPDVLAALRNASEAELQRLSGMRDNVRIRP